MKRASRNDEDARALIAKAMDGTLGAADRTVAAIEFGNPVLASLWACATALLDMGIQPTRDLVLRVGVEAKWPDVHPRRAAAELTWCMERLS